MQKSLFDEFAPTSDIEWQEKIIADLKGKPIESLTHETEDGIKIPPYFTAEKHFSDTPPLPKAGNWQVHHDFAIQNIESILQCLEKSQFHLNSIGLLFPAYTSTFPGAPFGAGVYSHSLQRLSNSLKKILNYHCPLHLTAGIAAPAFYTALIHTLEKQDKKPESLSGSIDNNPIRDITRYGLTARDRHNRFQQAGILLHHATQHFPQFKTLRISTLEIALAGATPALEIAVLLAQITDYIEIFTQKEIPLKNILSQLMLQVSVGNDFFPELAKIRALRKLLPTFFSAYQEKEALPPIWGQASPAAYSRLDPESNLLRATTQTACAMMAGCQQISIPDFATPSPATSRINRNIQLVLAHESLLLQVNDPVAGSYYAEYLTSQIAEKAWEIFLNIEAEGGFLNYFDTGKLQSLLRQNRLKHQEKVNSGEIVLVGINKFPGNKPKFNSTPESSQSPLPPLKGHTLEEWKSEIKTFNFDAVYALPKENEKAIPPVLWAADFEEMYLKGAEIAKQQGSNIHIQLSNEIPHRYYQDWTAKLKLINFSLHKAGEMEKQIKADARLSITLNKDTWDSITLESESHRQSLPHETSLKTLLSFFLNFFNQNEHHEA